jgi:MFS transporter, DHA2 family, multidrug resistance protein
VFSALLLMPLFLQDIQGYPVITAGIIISVRGIGTAAGMIMAGRLAKTIEFRYIIAAAMAIITVPSLYMAAWTDDVPAFDVIVVSLATGFGIGLSWVSLTTATFTTLPPTLRTEGAALFALLRVIGASIGVSMFVAVLARSTQVSYGALTEHIHGFNDALQGLHPEHSLNLDSLTGIAQLSNMVIHQAQTIAFLNDFKLLVATTIAGIPLALLFRNARQPSK